MVNPQQSAAMKTEPTPSTSAGLSVQSSGGSGGGPAVAASSKGPSLSEMAKQMKDISDRMAVFIRDSHLNPSLQPCSTKDDIAVCNDVEVMRKRCLNLHREKEMMRIQLDILSLQRQLDQESHLRRGDEIRDDAVEGCKTEFCTKIVETLQSEFSCSICNEVFMQPTVTNCGHTFCNYCIMEWTHDKRNCPICRKWIPDAGNLQKHVEMDNFVTKIYGFLGGEWMEGRNALERDRAETSRNAVQRRETEARESSSNASRMRYPSGFLQFPFERRRRIERYLDEERLLNNNNNNINNNNNEPVNNAPPSSLHGMAADLPPVSSSSSFANDPWFVARRLNANIAGTGGSGNNISGSAGASVSNSPITAPGQLNTAPTSSTPRPSNEEMNVQRELYRRLVYMESDRFQNLPRTYQQHILRTLYGDRGDSSILTDPSVMNAMLASRPRGERDRGDGGGSGTGAVGSTGTSSSSVPAVSMYRASLPSYAQSETGNTPPRYLSMLRRIQDSHAHARSRYSRYRTRPSGLDRDGGAGSSGSGSDRPHRRAAVELIQHVLGRSSSRMGGAGGGGQGQADSASSDRQRCPAFRHSQLMHLVEGNSGVSRGSSADRPSSGGNGNSGMGGNGSQDSDAVVFPISVSGPNSVEVRVGSEESGNANSSNHDAESDEVVLLEWPGNEGSSQNGNNNEPSSNDREQRENLPYSPVSPLARDVEGQEAEGELGDEMDISNIWN